MIVRAAFTDAAALHLRARALACRRGARLLFRDLHVELHGGELLWVRGHNGSGKTSLLRLLAGLAPPAEGSVECLAGQPLYLGHHNALKDELSVAESLAFLLRLQGSAADPASVAWALDRMGLKPLAPAPVRLLSQGQRRRVALARLVAASAVATWLLDEPFDALDLEGCARLHELIVAHRRRGGSVLLTSHQFVQWPGLAPRELDLDGLPH